MTDRARPLSPHIQVYRWQIQMVTSILHRATGIALAVGSLLVVWGVLALATSESAFDLFKSCIGNPVGIILLVGWSWSLTYHLCNGIRHLAQDAGAGYQISQFVRSSWLSVIGSIVLLVVIWAYVILIGGAA